MGTQEEEGRIIALQGERANIALEPGAQLELSGEQCETVHCADKELRRHLKHLLPIADELDIDFVNLGVQPVSPLDDIQWIPKTRYQIMAPYMEKVGTLGHHMMKQTASIQVNFDFSDEADAMLKFKTSMGLVPILSAMFANSPISDGSLNGFMTMRGHVWTETDKRRCGLLPFAFADAPTFEDYAEYALNIPMYFIVRQGQWINMTHMSFRQFLEEGHEGERPTLEDWGIHLTTLFPEVRIKNTWRFAVSTISRLNTCWPSRPSPRASFLIPTPCWPPGIWSKNGAGTSVSKPTIRPTAKPWRTRPGHPLTRSGQRVGRDCLGGPGAT